MEALTSLNLEKEILIKKEKTRLINDFENLCCICLKNKKKNKSNTSEDDDLFNLKIHNKKNISEEHFCENHIICSICIHDQGKVYSSQFSIISQISSSKFCKNVIVECKICGLDHKTDINPNIKSNSIENINTNQNINTNPNEKNIINPINNSNPVIIKKKTCCNGCNIF